MSDIILHVSDAVSHIFIIIIEIELAQRVDRLFIMLISFVLS